MKPPSSTILTVTPNPAVDITYVLDELRPHTTHRPRAVRERAGGKGLNVARVLTKLGEETAVLAPAGGAGAELLRTDLETGGIPHDIVDIAGATRRTVALVDDIDATLINEPGPEMTGAEWRALGERFDAVLPDLSAVVCSGSLPPGAPVHGHAELVGAARYRGVPVLLDTSGPALTAGVEAGPDVVKPNADELAEIDSDPLRAAQELRRRGAGAVVASLGADGMLAVTGGGAWCARPSRAVRGNPTGAGDAAVAALAAGLRTGVAWRDVLREAVAVSAAAVLASLAGDFDADHRRAEDASVQVQEISTVDGSNWGGTPCR